MSVKILRLGVTSILMLVILLMLTACSEDPLIEALKERDTQTIRDLIDQGNPLNVYNRAGDSALAIAIREGQLEVAEMLLNKKLDEGKLDVNTLGVMGVRPLMLAVSSGNADIVQALIDKGAPIDEKDNSGNRALMVLPATDQPAVIQTLLDNGADVNAGNHLGLNSLMVAAYMGHEQIAALLLENGASVNATTSSGQTALMRAAHQGKTGMIQLLLNAGADINLRDEEDESALVYALRKKQNAVADQLREAGATD